MHSIYVYGSVARGEAIPFKSDVDVTVILHSSVTTLEKDRIEHKTSKLLEDNHVIKKVDYDIGDLIDVVDSDNYYEWGFWLRHMCYCIYGKDLSTKFPAMKPNRMISRALNKDLVPTINGQIQDLKSDKEISILEKRSVLKKLIRGAYLTVNVQDESWSTRTNENLEILSLYFTNEAIVEELHLFYETEEVLDNYKYHHLLQRFKLWYEKQY
nr:nucleotidyltransferase domain-containing protein [Geomicrobium sediminis]